MKCIKSVLKVSHSSFPRKPTGSTSLVANAWTQRKKEQNMIPLRPTAWVIVSLGSFPLRPGHMSIVHFHVPSFVCWQVWSGGRGTSQTSNHIWMQSSSVVIHHFGGFPGNLTSVFLYLSYRWNSLGPTKVPEITAHRSANHGRMLTREEILINIFIHTNFIPQPF